MARHNRSDLLKKFKEKVIGKLFGYPDTDASGGEDNDYQDSEHPVDVNIDHLVPSSSSLLSGLDIDRREHEVRIYGAQCCPTGSKAGGHANEPVRVVGSSPYLGDDEASYVSVNTRKRKKKRGPHPSQHTQHTASTSSSSSGNDHLPHTSNNVPQSAESSLTKNQKRKLKKKRREKEKRAGSKEFTFDHSMNNNRSEKQRQKSSEDYESKKNSVCEFLQAVMDIFTVEIPSKEEETSKIQSIMSTLEQTDPETKKEVLLLHSVISTVIHGSHERSVQKINDFQKNTILNGENKDFATKMLEYWINKIVKNGI